MFFLVGVLLFGLGVVGEYIGRIYAQVRQRPRFVIATVFEDGERERGLAAGMPAAAAVPAAGAPVTAVPAAASGSANAAAASSATAIVGGSSVTAASAHPTARRGAGGGA